MIMRKKGNISSLSEKEIKKNNGKRISKTVEIIKKHEKLYTAVLVIIFMIVIVTSVYLGLKADTIRLYDTRFDPPSSLAVSSQIISLTNKNIMSDREGLDSEKITLKFLNNTGRNLNFVIRFLPDEETIKKCNCEDKIIDFTKIKFSLDGKKVQTFKNEDMIVTTGMLKNRKTDTIGIKFWIDEKEDKLEECYYYGKLVLEELKNMD